MALLRVRHATRNLTHNPVVLSVKRPVRRSLVVVFCLFSLTLMVTGVAWFTDGWQQWQRDQDDLQKEIDRMRLEWKIESAVRQKLERKIVELQKQLKNAELQLDFVKSNQALN